jgi:RNA polymerase sigma-70 factor (ECF subfamily)
MSEATVADQRQRAAIERAAGGDQVAFEQLVAAHHAYLRRVAMVVCRDVDAAEDAAQRAWQICWTKLHTLRDTARVRPWLATIVANEARKIAERDRRRAILEIAVSPAQEAADPAAAIDQIDLGRALARLSSSDRELLSLRFVAGLDSTEISELRGGSPSSVRGQLARVVARLRRELDHG